MGLRSYIFAERRLAGACLALFGCLVGLAGAAATRVDAQEGSTGPRREGAPRLVLAYYEYGFQGDPRKSVPTRGIRDVRGLTRLTDHPWDSVGPWMSYDRTQWHRNQFQMMMAGGVDVALAVYRGGLADRRGYAIKGLDTMTQALKEMRGEGASALTSRQLFPRIGLALDLRGLADQYGGKADLTDADVQRSLYGMVRDFYLHVPEEFRAAVQLPATRRAAQDAAGGNAQRGVAYVVSLTHDEVVTGAGAQTLESVNKRFAAEFGARLIWVGSPSLARRLPALDGAAAYPAAGAGVELLQHGWLRTASLGPGADASSQGPDAVIRPRDNGIQMVQDLRRAIQAGPDWIFVDSWNDYARGTDIAPSLEHGQQYRDLLRAAVLDFKQSEDYSALFLRANAPRVIRHGPAYQIEVVVQNSGTSDWDQTNVASLTYRWFQNGKPVGLPGVTIQRTGQKRGDTRPYLIGVVGPATKDEVLPPGEYELEFAMSRLASGEEVFFDGGQQAAYRVPVTVGAPPALHPTWVSSAMVVTAQRGATYPVEVRVRNDGSETWKKGVFSVGHRWRKVSTYLKGGPGDGDTILGEGPRLLLPEDVPPGRIATLTIPVPVQWGSQPLQTSSQQDDWCYLLEWDLYDGQKYVGTEGAPTLREAVVVVDRDPAPHFLGCSLGADLVAGKTYPITVGLRNAGPNEWKARRDKVVVHWYYLDGSEASWTDETLPLPTDVPPFSRLEVEVPDDSPFPLEKSAADAKDKDPKARRAKGKKSKTHRETIVQDVILREVPVRVPYYFGPMFCVFDFQHDGLPASTAAATRGMDTLVIPVNVFSPTFTPLPLASLLNTDGISSDVDRSDGDLDGFGNTLPAEQLPPYVARPATGEFLAPSPLYPSGLWVRPLNDLENSRVCFLYPNKATGAGNMVSCQGQELVFPGALRTALHLLAVCTRSDMAGEFVLSYSDGTKERKPLKFTHWTEPPKHGERLAFVTPHRHTLRGDDPASRCHLNHYTLPTERLKQLVGLQLPRLPEVKIIAVTLENATLRTN